MPVQTDETDAVASADSIEPSIESGTLGRNSAARFAAELAVAAVGAISAVITARWLGPAGKGTAAALSFLAAILMRTGQMGLGESGIVFVGKRIVTPARAFAANLGAVLVTGGVATLAFFAIASWQIDSGSSAVLAFGAGVLAGAVLDVFTSALVMRQRVVQASLVILVLSVASLAGTILFVVILSLGVAGAGLGLLFGACTGLCLAAALVDRNLLATPSWNRSYLRRAVPYGLRLEASSIVSLAAARLDLLLVYSILGASYAGNYSIALTLGGLVGIAPFAISYAAFPQLAYSASGTADDLAARTFRVGLIASAVLAVALAVASVLLLTVIFGAAFSPALTPTLILLGSSVLFGGQWTLARSEAARGKPNLILRSFAATLGLMVALDLILIPPFHLVGAALASTVAYGLGLAICVWERRGRGAHQLAALIPRGGDVLDLAHGIRSLLRRGRVE
jgi:O-antigen/teichoic acid export membrane protein